MCYDAWEESVYQYAQLYLGAIYESQRADRSPEYRHIWAGKAEFFAKGYPDKLAELDNDDLEEWLEEIESDFDSVARLLEPAEKELKNRAEATNV